MVMALWLRIGSRANVNSSENQMFTFFMHVIRFLGTNIEKSFDIEHSLYSRDGQKCLLFLRFRRRAGKTCRKFCEFQGFYE